MLKNKGLFTATLFTHHHTSTSSALPPWRGFACAPMFRMFITLWLVWVDD